MYLAQQLAEKASWSDSQTLLGAGCVLVVVLAVAWLVLRK